MKTKINNFETTYNFIQTESANKFTYSINIPEVNNQLLTSTVTPEAATLEAVEDIIDIETEVDTDGIDKYDYIIAASSGILTAAMDVLWIKGISIEDAAKWGEKEAIEFVKAVARNKADYKGDDIGGAIRKLEKVFGLVTDANKDDFGGGKRHHLNDFAHHPTLFGLIFSILSQFTEKAFGTDQHGNFIVRNIINKDLIGTTVRDKLTKGTIVWAFHLISDMVGSSSNPGKGTGIPGPLLASFKEIASLPIIKEITINYHKENRKDEEIDIATFISRLFSGTYFAEYDENGKMKKGTPIKFDFRTELGIAEQISRQAIPVVANECIVRGFYFVRRLCDELKNVKSLKDITGIDIKRVIPYGNRTIARMMTVSSGIFVTIVTTKASIKAAKSCNGNRAEFVTAFLLNINYPGTVRFALSLRTEISYFTEDMIYAYKKKLDMQATSESQWLEQVSALGCLSLDEKQSELLLSLQRDFVLYDITKTRNSKEKQLKEKWIMEWQKHIPISMITDRELLYNAINEELGANSNTHWIYLIAMELILFEPYYALRTKDTDDKEYLKLRKHDDYIENVFCNYFKLNYCDKFIELKKSLKKNKQIIEDKTLKKSVLKGTAVVAVGAATGGLAYAFAPGIAVVLAGEAVAGLSGAALTSASLAFIGGGSIAAGGFGMAGGTAIITGGGAVLGMLGSGTVSSIAKIESMYENGITTDACAKLLSYCKDILIGTELDYITVSTIQSCLENNINEIEKIIKEQKALKKDTADKNEMKNIKAKVKSGDNVLTQMCRCNHELNRMLKEYNEQYKGLNFNLYFNL